MSDILGLFGPSTLGLAPCRNTYGDTYDPASMAAAQQADWARRNFMHEMMRDAWAVTREQRAEAILREGIASGALPDWPAWSEQAAREPL